MGWPRVVIAGGSIGGLTTAALLRDLGCRVDVYERSPSPLEDRGAGIVVLPITERYFRERAEEDERVSLELTYWTYVDREGRILSADPDHYRFSGWNTIYRALLDAFGTEHYHLGREVVGFEEDQDGVTAVLADGERVGGDLLVFADGFGSTGRSILMPEVVPEYAGYVAWRGTTPENSLNPATRRQLADAMVYQVLDAGHILVYAIPDHFGRTSPGHRVINSVWYRNYPTGGPFEDLMVDRDGRRRAATVPPGGIRPEPMREMQTTARRVLAPILLEVVMGCDQPLIQAIFDLASPRMAFGRICLIGDAAATIRPHLAAGQAKACADAWALRDALRSSGGEVRSALAKWEPQQLALAHDARNRSRAMGTASQFDGTMIPGDPAWKFGLWEPGN
ncbi:MAG: FAD-dependent monooxygenase [Acidimicrobiia bacterium]